MSIVSVVFDKLELKGGEYVCVGAVSIRAVRKMRKGGGLYSLRLMLEPSHDPLNKASTFEGSTTADER